MPGQLPSVKRRACVECRQQKLRCDASQNPTNTCSRCRKFGIQCLFSDTFQRRKRHTKAQMQREIDSLRRQVNGHHPGRSTGPDPTAVSLSPIGNGHFVAENPNSSQVGEESPEAAEASNNLTKSFTEALEQDGLDLEPYKINDCFNLFFAHYHQYLPILQEGYSPSDYFALSPFLFWAIIAVGARRYTQDPTILSKLAPRVTTLAFLSAPKIQVHLETIQGLLLICNWPFPMDTIYSDPTMVFSGVLMQLAVQNGLHMIGQRLDFVQSPCEPDESQESFRARLWLHTKVVCQNTNLFTGLPPHIVPDCYSTEPEKLARLLRPGEMQRHQVQTTLVQALKTLMAKTAEDSPLSTFIDVFDSQLLENIRALTGGLSERSLTYAFQNCADLVDDVYLYTARLHIRAFQLLDSTQPAQLVPLIELHQLAISFINIAADLEETEGFASHSPEAFFRTLSLACCVLLRISRSTLRLRMDLTAGERAFFTGINLFKRRSIQKTDINSRSVAVMQQIWQSRQIFRKSDGTVDSLHVRVRNRGSMGVVYDCLWYWRQETNGIPDPYSKPTQSDRGSEGSLGSIDPLLSSLDMDATTTPPTETQFPFITDINTLLPEWEWFFNSSECPM